MVIFSLFIFLKTIDFLPFFCILIIGEGMQKEINDLLQRYVETPQITLKSWELEEFCEKNVIIFGQLEKK
jgi:hypothetical protein